MLRRTRSYTQQNSSYTSLPCTRTPAETGYTSLTSVRVSVITIKFKKKIFNYICHVNIYSEYLKHSVFSEISFLSSSHTMTNTNGGRKALSLLTIPQPCCEETTKTEEAGMPNSRVILTLHTESFVPYKLCCIRIIIIIEIKE